MRDHVQLFQLIALGRACALVPETAVAGRVADIAAMRVTGAPAVATVIALAAHIRSMAVAETVHTVTCLVVNE